MNNYKLELKKTDSFNEGLTKIVEEAESLDDSISKTLAYETGTIKKIPLIRNLYKYFIDIKPLPVLERSLKNSINTLMKYALKIAKKGQSETLEIQTLEDLLKEAKEKKYTSKQYLDIIEQTTDISFELEGYDFKDVIENLEKKVGTEKIEKQEWYTWFEKHLKTRKTYLHLTEALGLATLTWVKNLAKGYFDIVHTNEQMMLIQTTLEKISDGAVKTYTIDQTIKEYAQIYAKGITKLFQAYQETRKQLSEDSDAVLKTHLYELDNELKKLSEPIKKKELQLN